MRRGRVIDPASLRVIWSGPARPGSGGRRNRGRRVDRHLGFVRKHRAKDLLEGEEVDADVPGLEVVAGAVPPTGVETDMVRVVVAAEREREPFERDSIELTRVAIGLLDLADQGAVHRARPSVAPSRGCRRPPSGPAPSVRARRLQGIPYTSPPAPV